MSATWPRMTRVRRLRCRRSPAPGWTTCSARCSPGSATCSTPRTGCAACSTRSSASTPTCRWSGRWSASSHRRRATWSVPGTAPSACWSVGPGRRLREFVTAGLTDEERAAIGELPRGHGILGVIIDRPEPLRLPVLGDDPSSYGFPPNHPPMETFLGRADPDPRPDVRQPLPHREAGRRHCSPPRTRRSSSRWPPRPVSSSRTPGCSRRPRGASAGSRRQPR